MITMPRLRLDMRSLATSNFWKKKFWKTSQLPLLANSPIYFAQSIHKFLGPLVPVKIAVNSHLAAYFENEGIEVPKPIQTLGLVDTGSFYSAIRPGMAGSLKLRQVDRVPVLATGSTTVSHYPAFYGGTELFDTVSLDLKLVEFALEFNRDVGVLIGRDLLESFQFEYKREQRAVFASFHRHKAR